MRVAQLSGREYIPSTIGEVRDFLSFVMLWAPRFKPNGNPPSNLDSVYEVLLKSIARIEGNLGAEKARTLNILAAEMMEAFSSDMNDENGGSDRGREIVFEMKNVLKAK